MTDANAAEGVYDYLVVGAGAAGCVMASRLSERPDRRVLLLEAGADTEPGKTPADILDPYPRSYFNPRYRWPGLRAYWRKQVDGAALPIEQGRVMGGSASIMGMVALRGTPDDYAEWEAAGAAGWGWESVLPYFRRLETDSAGASQLHGSDGPIYITRRPVEDWPAVARAGATYAASRGIPVIDDPNADFRDGYCSVPIAAAELRQSTSLTYLGAKVRARKNLAIAADATVERIVIKAGTAVGIDVVTAAGRRRILAREIIVSAGTLHSPVLLQRSGLGPATHLRALGIEVVRHMPGVGANLQNHPVIYLGGHLRRAARDSTTGNHNFTSFRWSSGVAGAPPSDMYLTLFNRTAWHALGRRIAGFSVVLNKPASRGSVRLEAPSGGSRIEFNFLEHDLDVARMVAGVLHARAVLTSAEMSAVLHHVFPIVRSDRVRRLSPISHRNRWQARAVSALLDAAPYVSQPLLRAFVASGADLNRVTADTSRLRAHVTAHIGGLAHHVGTCRMGDVADVDAVVDSQGRVHGVGALRVVDASVMPAVPRGNTFLPTVMVAEKIADAMRVGAC